MRKILLLSTGGIIASEVKALKTGVIPAGDMVKEAIVIKLMWTLGHTQDLNECGEIRGS